jgi:hypothetical protein
VHDVTHGKLNDLSAPRARNFRDLHDSGRYVPRRSVLPDPAADAIFDRWRVDGRLVRWIERSTAMRSS